jgi:NADH-quinone oxidoreductase subunit G
MPEIFINGKPYQADPDQTVLQVCLANGIYVPYFCWHPQLSVAGNCRICMIEEEGRGVDIGCNMPVKAGMRVLTESEEVRVHRKAVLQFITLNHPVDCGICDKAGECTLQDYHYEYNGSPSISHDRKVTSTKFYDLSDRIVLDNERCILCSRCVRFTREVSKSNGLGIEERADVTLVRPSTDGSFRDDAYSDNVVDICPVGALLSRSFFYKSRVWYLTKTESVCPGCERGCNVDIWHRKPEWFVQSLDAAENTAIARVTPRENPAVNGPWICNKGRDLANIFERKRALEPMLKGRPATAEEALAAARGLLAAARHPVAVVSSWGSNEELEAFRKAFDSRLTVVTKPDHVPEPGEVVEDDVLIRADKNPNAAKVRELFGNAATAIPADADLVLVWGEGQDFSKVPSGAKTVLLGSYLAPENGHADVFLPISIQTERDGHYTNFQGTVSGFRACFPKAPGVADAGSLFAALAGSAP